MIYFWSKLQFPPFVRFAVYSFAGSFVHLLVCLYCVRWLTRPCHIFHPAHHGNRYLVMNFKSSPLHTTQVQLEYNPFQFNTHELHTIMNCSDAHASTWMDIQIYGICKKKTRNNTYNINANIISTCAMWKLRFSISHDTFLMAFNDIV